MILALASSAVGLALGFMLEDTGMLQQGRADTQRLATTGYDSMAWNETVARLNSEVAMLSERERTILHQHYVNGVVFDQIAELCGVTKGRVSQLHRAALERLRKRMCDQQHFKLER